MRREHPAVPGLDKEFATPRFSALQVRHNLVALAPCSLRNGHLRDQPAQHVGGGPAVELTGKSIHVSHETSGVGRDHGLTDLIEHVGLHAYRLVRSTAIGNVLAGTDSATGLTLLVANDLPALFHELDPAIRHQKSMLDGAGRALIERSDKRLIDTRAVLRMDHLQEGAMRGLKVFRDGFEDTVRLGRPDGRPCRHIRFPTANARQGLRGEQTRALGLELGRQRTLHALTPLRRVLRLFEIVDVGAGADPFHDEASAVARWQPADQHPPITAIGRAQPHGRHRQ